MNDIDDKTKIKNLEEKLRRIKKNYDAMLNEKIQLVDMIEKLKNDNNKLVKIINELGGI